jgi:hypothetical protein
LIKFFRKIRKGLLSENRFGKYLLYAIGEIVLVVIGILIALNLNNRNEQRKTEAGVEIIFGEILEELISDIEETAMPMKYFAVRDSVIRLVLSDNVTYDDYRYGNVPYLNALLNFHNPVNLTQNAYSNLISDLEMVPAKFKPVIKDLDVLYNYYKDFVVVANNEMADFISENQSFGMKNHPWWYIRNESELNQSIEFRLKDWRYKNLVNEYRNLGIGNQLRMSIMYRNKAIECYKKIAKLIDKPLDHESTIFNQIMAEELVGDWQFVGQSEEEITIFLEDKRLYGKNSTDDKWEFFYFSDNKIVDSDLDYATIVRENDEIILKYYTYSLKKKD